MSSSFADLPWLTSGMPFPDADGALPAHSDAAGLLAAGGDLEPATLLRAYSNGIYPWFSEGQPPLWWCPDPRMTLEVSHFRLHRSLRKTLVQFKNDTQCEVKFDSAFANVIQACANAPRQGQSGTWIVPSMVHAYTRLHGMGHVHSIETWMNGKLAGGLYCVALGHAVFGESMFAHVPDASKIALAALIAFCREKAIAQIDCQQNTSHLASLGATEISRAEFLKKIHSAQQKQNVEWSFNPLYWKHILSI